METVRPARRLGWLAAAAVLASVAAWGAPDDWTAGPAVLEIRYRDDVVVTAPVELGSTEPFERRDASGTVTVEVVAPVGFPVDAPIEVIVVVDDPGHRPALGDLRMAIVDGDGAEELVPVLGADGAEFRGTRRPARDAAVVVGVLAAAIVLWVSETVPLFVTALAIPVALAVTEVGSAEQALAPFFDPIIVLFLGGFLMAEAMRRAGLDRVVATSLVAVAGRGAVSLFVALVGLSAFLSMWMSNTAAVALLLPITLAVTEPLGSDGYRKAAVLGIAYAATIGGVGSAIGTPANQLAISFVGDLTGRQISFAEWLRFGVPMLVVFLPVMAGYLWVSSSTRVDPGRVHELRAAARRERAEAGRLTRPQLEVLGVFVAVVAVWLTQSWHDLDTGIVALAGALVLFALGRCEPGDLGRISWSTLLTFGGGLTLGTFMVTSGVSDWSVSRLDGLARLPDPLALAAVAGATLALTAVASNTAAAATLIPLAVPLAGLVGLDPVLLVVVVAVASSIDFALVIGTPPTMLAYSTELFTVREILARGAPLDVAGVALLVAVVVPLWGLLGVL